MTKYLLKGADGDKITTGINYAQELNAEQLAVVTHGEGPCLVLAGAGSGKTRALTYRVAYLIEHGVPADRILLMTFTNKAAREMMQRVGQIMGQELKGLTGGTFHHVGNLVLRQYAKALGYQPNFNILDSDDSQSVIKSCYGELGLTTKDKRFPKASTTHAVLSYALNTNQSIETALEERFRALPKEYLGDLEKVAALYARKKQAMNAMDFDDLLANWLKLMIVSESARAALRARWPYILVDEYQDTNHIQSSLINALADTNGNLLVVGDDAQSIYSFRGADVNNILQFPEDHPAAKTCRLETNYRSTLPILELANASIRQNQKQFEKNLRPVKTGQQKPTLAAVNNNYDQASFVAQRVIELEDEGVELNEMAVLCRSAYHMIELELELNKRRIPYLVRGGVRFFEQAHIKDVLAWLKIINNHQDELSWKRVLMMMNGIGTAGAEQLWQRLRPVSELTEVALTLKNLPAGQKVRQSLDLVGGLYQKILSETRPGEMINAILENYYEEYLKTAFDNANDRLLDLRELARFAAGYPELASLLSETGLAEGYKGSTVTDYHDAEERSLVLTTIHQSKGLEWHTVFVIGLADGQFPHAKVFENPEELEEERRLFYVAVTRAKEQLYCLYPIISDSYATGRGINRPSVFLTEVDEDHFDRWEIEGVYEQPTTNYLNF